VINSKRVKEPKMKYFDFRAFLGWIPGFKIGITSFEWAIFLIQKVGTNSVIQAASLDIKILVQFPGNSILKILQNFWKCVGGVYMRGCLIFKITQRVQLFTPINFISEIRGIHLISWQPTQFSPPLNPFLTVFLVRTFFRVEPRP